jgi:hypothetical protein
VLGTATVESASPANTLNRKAPPSRGLLRAKGPRQGVRAFERGYGKKLQVMMIECVSVRVTPLRVHWAVRVQVPAVHEPPIRKWNAT